MPPVANLLISSRKSSSKNIGGVVRQIRRRCEFARKQEIAVAQKGLGLWPQTFDVPDDLTTAWVAVCRRAGEARIWHLLQRKHLLRLHIAVPCLIGQLVGHSIGPEVCAPPLAVFERVSQCAEAGKAQVRGSRPAVLARHMRQAEQRPKDGDLIATMDVVEVRVRVPLHGGTSSGLSGLGSGILVRNLTASVLENTDHWKAATASVELFAFNGIHHDVSWMHISDSSGRFANSSLMNLSDFTGKCSVLTNANFSIA
eukprot:CAMPEP_0170416536 /NCGR_PEP_ID=MMETSP0117_2-20130122/33211_1 /TAXON_ID=400756 /ORGANISM="Durinskia baltica, Strain CSIRO CS-38" /LENGTH=255 /DNA_ID=CAMNT_0010674613 /DNA_START=28 /DNA_END=796 /DNA_ORIENTATION=+